MKKRGTKTYRGSTGALLEKDKKISSRLILPNKIKKI